MKHRPGFHPDARREMREARDFYDLERTGLGDEFVDAVPQACSLWVPLFDHLRGAAR